MWGHYDANVVGWLRDWWVGRGYGRCVVHSGESERTISELQAKLASGALDPSGLESRLIRSRLAYILEARGEQHRADRMWKQALASGPQAKEEPSKTVIVALPASK